MKGASKVIFVYPDGDLLMEDDYFCNVFRLLTVNNPSISSGLIEIKDVSEIESDIWHKDEFRWSKKKHSVISLVDKSHNIKEGDYLYSHNIFINE